MELYHVTFCLNRDTVARVGCLSRDSACLEIGEPIWPGADSMKSTLNIWFDGPNGEEKAARVAKAINEALAERDEAPMLKAAE